MSSKQQSPRQSHNPSPIPQQPTVRSLIFSNVSFDGHNQILLRDLKSNYVGINEVSQLYLQENNGNSIDAIRIDFKSDNLAIEFLNKKSIYINNKQYSVQLLTRSFIVSKVASSDNEAKLLQDLGHNYLGIEKISRFYDKGGKPVDHIRIDCKSDSLVTKILKDNYILIDGKRRTVQPYVSLICDTNQNEKVSVTENSEKSVTKQTQQPQNSWAKPPQKYLTEQRVKELFQEQQMQLEAMINAFENKWNERLLSLTTSSTKVNVDQMLPILKDLTTVCQQFNQQNSQMQRQLTSIVHRAQNIQMTSNNEQEQSWPQLSLQNGH